MFKYKYITFILAYAVLFSASIVHGLNSVSSTAAFGKKTTEEELLNTNITQKNFVKSLDSQSFFKPVPNMSENKRQSSILIISNSKGSNSNVAEFNLSSIKSVFVFCFLLFFVSLGIFYPLFLFYRKLLNINYNELIHSLKNPASKSDRIDNPQELDIEKNKASPVATVSKLQIAFSPQADLLRQKLEQVCLERDSNKELNLVELVQKSISVLTFQPYWTHVNYNSFSLHLREAKAEFDVLFYGEKTKFNNQKLNYISDIQLINSNNLGQKVIYNYIVVTLVFCTTHTVPLFDNIYTKKQLINELAKLNKIQQNQLIKFELLWNPQNEYEYINNEQLLTEYSEMNRLF